MATEQNNEKELASTEGLRPEKKAIVEAARNLIIPDIPEPEPEDE